MAKKKPTPETEDGAKPKKKKLPLIVALIVVIGAGGFGYTTMTKKAAAAVKGAPTTTVAGQILEESSLTVNLRDNHYLQFTAALECAPGKTYSILVTDQPIVLDILNDQAGAMSETQLLQPGGQAKLKANIVRALGQDWPGLIVNVFFEQFVMQ
jgi:flagellar basal body-associated protein FliL